MFGPIVFGLYGLITGSFLNVFIVRWGKHSLNGRSRCPSCGAEIAWYDLIPVVSWIALGARCRECKTPISVQYVLVEAITGALFFLIGLASLPVHIRIIALAIAFFLIAIAVYDFRTKMIPDLWVYASAALALFAALLSLPEDWSAHLISVLLSGPVLALPLFSIWFFSRGAGMGLGDVKFALVMGWLLGIPDGFRALFLAFMLGAVVGIPLLFFSSSLGGRMIAAMGFTPTSRSRGPGLGFTMKSEIPFGPFLVVSTCVLWILAMHGIHLPLFFTGEDSL